MASQAILFTFYVNQTNFWSQQTVIVTAIIKTMTKFIKEKKIAEFHLLRCLNGLHGI